MGVQRFTCSRSLKLKSVNAATAKLRMDQIYKLSSYEDRNHRFPSSRMRSKCFQPTRAQVIIPSRTVASLSEHLEVETGRGSRFSIQTTPEPGRLTFESSARSTFFFIGQNKNKTHKLTFSFTHQFKWTELRQHAII